jgi:hypothetical protein
LETPVNPEKVMAKKKRLKRIIKAITKAQKLNKKRLRRLEEVKFINLFSLNARATPYCDVHIIMMKTTIANIK